jgi:nucleoside-diphosphate-sugar epimerase
VEGADYVQQDLAQPWDERLVRFLGRADAVLHAAARSSPWGTRRQFEQSNVEATRRLIAMCEERGQPQLVFVSSSSVYYRPCDQLGIREGDPPADQPVNRYAATKLAGESLVRGYSGPWVIVRPRAVYGPGDTVLFPRILNAARAGRLPLLVRPGSPVVGDLICIDNLVHCLCQALADPKITGEFNLTDNQPVEIQEFLGRVFDRLSIARPVKQVPVATAFRVARVLEAFYGVALPWLEPPITRFGVHVFAYSKTFDVSRMLETFGPPPITTEEGISRFVEWVRQTNPYGPA